MIQIEIGKPFIECGATHVPVKFTYPNGFSEETTIIWGESITPDKIIADLKDIYVEWYKKHKNTLSPINLKSIEGRKINDVFE